MIGQITNDAMPHEETDTRTVRAQTMVSVSSFKMFWASVWMCVCVCSDVCVCANEYDDGP